MYKINQAYDDAQYAAEYKELARDMFGDNALNGRTTFLDFKRRHELNVRRLLPELFRRE